MKIRNKVLKQNQLNKMKAMRKTIVQTARERIEMNRQIVMNILDFDDLTHNTMLYETGLHFLANHITPDSESYQKIIRDRMYWNWFRNEWSYASDTWIKMYLTLTNCDLQRIRNSYIHSISKYFIEETESKVTVSF